MKKNIRNIAITAAALTLTAATTLTAFAGEQLAKIQDEGVLKVGIEGTYPPFTYHDDDDNLTGFDVELARAIAEKLGVEAEFTESAWDSLLTAIDTDRIDWRIWMERRLPPMLPTLMPQCWKMIGAQRSFPLTLRSRHMICWSRAG